MTGCYPNRIGIHGALPPQATHGISAREITLAEIVKQKGHATSAIGKWHLGHLPQFLPTRHGFDEYYGLPYSNDMWPWRYPYDLEKRRPDYPNLPMIENDQVVDAEVTAEEQARLTTDYTDRAVRFIERSKDKPFLLFLAHSMVHVPLFVSDKFKGKSGKGLYADVMMEVDWSVGRIIDCLKREGLEKNTWVICSSDNGPWLSYGDHAGSAGIYREGKGTSWEGGTRVSCIMRWPGKIPAGTASDAMLMTIDVLPTVAAVIGAQLPEHPIDGKNVWPILAGESKAKNPHEFYATYYAQNELQAVTTGDGRWKLHLPHGFTTLGNQPKATGGKPVRYAQARVESPELYDLKADPSESRDVSAQNPAVVDQLQKYAAAIRAQLGDSLLKQPKGTGTRKPGGVD